MFDHGQRIDRKLTAIKSNNKFLIFEKFELPDGSYPVLDIQDYFKYITKKHEKMIYSSPINIYVNIRENRITFRIKIGYYLQLLKKQ